jgi:hypothetical protein
LCPLCLGTPFLYLPSSTCLTLPAGDPKVGESVKGFWKVAGSMVPLQRPGDFNQVSKRRKVFRPPLLKCMQAGPFFLTSICHLNVGRGLWSWVPPCARPHRQGVTSVPSAFTAARTRRHPRILQCLWCGHPAHVAPRGPCLSLLFRSQHALQCFLVASWVKFVWYC